MSSFVLGAAGAFCLGALLTAAMGATPVADAAMNGNVAMVRSLLEQGADVNAARADGMTALHWAALNGDLDLARMLLYAGANVHASSRIGGYTALHIAAEDGQGALVDVLLKGGADANERDEHGTTALMFASASGSTQSVKALLAAGADVNAVERVKHETALMFAAANGRTDVVNLLMDHGADWKSTTKILDWTSLAEDDPRLPAFGRRPAAKKAAGRPTNVKGAASSQQMPPRAGATSDERRSAGATAAPNRRAQARAGGGNGADHLPKYVRLVGTQGGLSALMFAARQGYIETVQALIRHRADVNEVDPGDHTSPLLIAIINGHFDLAEELLRAGADPTLAAVNGVTPLYAVLNCVWSDKAEYPQPTAYKQQETTYLTLMQDLLAHGAHVNVRLKEKVWYAGYDHDQSGLDETGATPFWRAAYADDVAAMKLLVAHGANPNIWTKAPQPRTRGGRNAATSMKDPSGKPRVPVGGPDISPLLAASGEAYGSSFTANRHRYAPAGMLPAVKYLVEELHVDVNERDADGNTALHNAAARGDNAMILYLVSKGADMTALNRKGQSVADMANGPIERISPFPDTIALAERLGAKLLHACVSCGS